MSSAPAIIPILFKSEVKKGCSVVAGGIEETEGEAAVAAGTPSEEVTCLEIGGMGRRDWYLLRPLLLLPLFAVARLEPLGIFALL